MDRQKVLKHADKLVRQGKLLQAAREYERLLTGDAVDLAALNKAGDLFARGGETQRAVDLFERTAAEFTDGGFFPKAIAIYKKILKIDPSRAESLVRLADLYGSQDLLADARSHYERAADVFENRGDAEHSREVWRKLVRIAPRDPRARKRMAECAELAGDQREAGQAWIALASELAGEGDVPGALEAASRGLEVDPLVQPPVPALAQALAGAEGGTEALAAVAAERPGAAAVLLIGGALLDGDAAAAEHYRKAVEEAPGCLALALAAAQKAGAPDELEAVWPSLDACVKVAAEAGRLGELVIPLSALSRAHADHGLLAERALQAAREAGGAGPLGESLERLAKIREAAGQVGEAEDLRKEASGLQPALPVSAVAAAAPVPAPRAAPAPAAAPAAPVARDAQPVASKEERDFLNEHMTEAEVFLKYGLVDRAVEQLRTVTERFPDHLEAHQKLKLAFQELGQARSAAGQARIIARLLTACGEPDIAAQELEEARHLDPEGSAGAGAPPAEDVPGPATANAAPATPPASEDEYEIDLDAAGDLGDAAPAIPVAPPPPAAAPPAPAAAGAADDGDGSFLDFAAEVGRALEEAEQEEAGAITSSEDEPRSLDDVVTAFRSAVDEQIDDEDFGTHYDLGIAYKEMGLVDESIAEFQYASRSPDRFLDCCSMLATLFREKGLPEQAEAWYRKGLEEPGQPEESYVGLRYELAELCAEGGRLQEARELYAHVFGVDANYRDVRERLAEIDGESSAVSP